MSAEQKFRLIEVYPNTILEVATAIFFLKRDNAHAVGEIWQRNQLCYGLANAFQSNNLGYFKVFDPDKVLAYIDGAVTLKAAFSAYIRPFFIYPYVTLIH